MKDKLLQVKKGIKVEIFNRHIYLGCHYPEDEWSIEVIAPTYEEAIKLLIPKYVKFGINPDSADVYNVEYVTYNGKECVLEIVSDYTPDTPIELAQMLSGIKSDPLFIKLKAESNEIAKKKSEEERKKRRLEITKAEIQRLNRLKKKYPDV